MAGKLRQGREIDLRRLFQPRLICFPVGVQYAYGTVAVSYTHLTLPTKLEV